MKMFSIQHNFWYKKKRKREKLCSCLLFVIMAEDESRKRKMWVSKWITGRKEKGLHHNLFLELALEDPNRFRR